MRKLIIFTVTVLLFTALCGFIPTSEDAEIYENVIRLHVIANSDTEEDQSVKLSIRDAVLSRIGEIAEGASDAGEAEAAIAENIREIRDIARAELLSLGRDEDVTVSITREEYPTKDYGELSLPAGRYTSLKIEIGAGEGQNWWCVLYPTICTSSAKAGYVLKQTGFSPEQIKILTDGEKPVYKIKFKILEILGQQGG